MQYRPLGTTGIFVSALSFGAGPISTLMVGDDTDRQRRVVSRAIEAGINWFDTAATYGGGQSERSLGRVLRELGVADQVGVATKVRLMPDDLADIRAAARRSLVGSLERLNLPRVTLLQLHNSITHRRGDEPTSITPDDVLGPQGVLAALRELQAEGLVQCVGLTGIGQSAMLSEVIGTGEFQTLQVPYHLLNPSAGQRMPSRFHETDYGNVIRDAARLGMGVFAIRVLAGGALANSAPSPHTLTTPFFPLALYERDLRRAARLQAALGPDRPLAAEAVRFALNPPEISSALIGFADVQQIDAALQSLERVGPALSWDQVWAACYAPEGEDEASW